MAARAEPIAKVREMVPFTLIPISCAAPLSSETASIACPTFVLLTKKVSLAIMITIVSPEIEICPSASLMAGTVTTEVKDLVFAPKRSNAVFCKK